MTAPRSGDGGAIVLVVDATVPPAVHEACLEAAAGLAERAGVPVTVACIPPCCLEDVQPLLTGGEESRTWQFAPAPAAAAMSAAPFVYREDGRPDWGAMWQSFCELALYGGPPHRGPDSALRAPGAETGAASDAEMIAEMQRGIWETTGLYSEPAENGWLAITCDSPRMAAWLCAAIILENVDARIDDDRLLLPAGPDYRLKDEVKSIVTVVAKTHHYWEAHATGTPAADGGARR
jgi:hypothetical protein